MASWWIHMTSRWTVWLMLHKEMVFGCKAKKLSEKCQLEQCLQRWRQFCDKYELFLSLLPKWHYGNFGKETDHLLPLQVGNDCIQWIHPFPISLHTILARSSIHLSTAEYTQDSSPINCKGFKSGNTILKCSAVAQLAATLDPYDLRQRVVKVEFPSKSTHNHSTFGQQASLKDTGLATYNFHSQVLLSHFYASGLPFMQNTPLKSSQSFITVIGAWEDCRANGHINSVVCMTMDIGRTDHQMWRFKRSGVFWFRQQDFGSTSCLQELQSHSVKWISIFRILPRFCYHGYLSVIVLASVGW